MIEVILSGQIVGKMMPRLKVNSQMNHFSKHPIENASKLSEKTSLK